MSKSLRKSILKRPNDETISTASEKKINFATSDLDQGGNQSQKEVSD